MIRLERKGSLLCTLRSRRVGDWLGESKEETIDLFEAVTRMLNQGSCHDCWKEGEEGGLNNEGKESGGEGRSDRFCVVRIREQKEKSLTTQHWRKHTKGESTLLISLKHFP